MIKREILSKINKWIGKEKILILNGSRQVGKTTILKEIKRKLEAENKKVIYLLADDFENKELFESLVNLEMFLKQNAKLGKEKIYLMIDEFQVIDNAGIFLKNIFDKHKEKIQLIVSGSSSLEINKNSEFLTGRAIHFRVERINFVEFFNYLNDFQTSRISFKNFSDLEIFYKTFKNKLEVSFHDYLIFGSYPEIVVTDNVDEKKEILKSIIKTYIEKDIINQLRVENVSGFNSLIKLLSSQIGKMMNTHEISNTIRLAENTLKKYIDILIGTYVFDLLTPYFKNIRSEISKMPKEYILDLGIRNYLLRDFSLDGDIGDLVENFVYLSLLSCFEKDYLNYYRTVSGSEIDFVIETDRAKNILCEVKYRRKVKAPLAFKNYIDKYPGSVIGKMVITKDVLEFRDDIYFIPACVFPFIKLSPNTKLF
jgi:hypothetical protein